MCGHQGSICTAGSALLTPCSSIPYGYHIQASLRAGLSRSPQSPLPNPLPVATCQCPGLHLWHGSHNGGGQVLVILILLFTKRLCSSQTHVHTAPRDIASLQVPHTLPPHLTLPKRDGSSEAFWVPTLNSALTIHFLTTQFYFLLSLLLACFLSNVQKSSENSTTHTPQIRFPETPLQFQQLPP